MDAYRDPTVPGLHRYAPGRHPYVEVRIPGQFPFHAQVEAWKGDDVMLSVATEIQDRFSVSHSATIWTHKSNAKRIRSSDSRWISSTDDFSWHAEQDELITYRPNPFTITQHDSDRPGAGGAD